MIDGNETMKHTLNFQWKNIFFAILRVISKRLFP